MGTLSLPVGVRRSSTEALAIMLWLLAIGGIVSGVVLWAEAGYAAPGFIFSPGPIPVTAYALATVTQSSAGLVLAIRRPSNAQGWLTIALGIDMAVGGFIFGFLSWAHQNSIPGETTAWLAWLVDWLTLPLGTLIAVWIGFIFPTGRLLSPNWWAGLGIAVFGALAMAATLALSPGPLVLFPTVTNPLTGSGTGWGVALLISMAIFVAAAPLTGYALLRRYAVADHVGRLQIRWFVTLSLGLEFAFVAFLAAIVLLPPHAFIGDVLLGALCLSAALPAVALLFAIFRYRLYDIDTIISRAFVYGALTAILAGLYAASMDLLQRLFLTATGEASDLALVLTTLILVASFAPLKNRLERFVEQRFGQTVAQPSDEAKAVLDDPAFLAALDARIAEALAGWARRSAQAATSTRSSQSGRPRRPTTHSVGRRQRTRRE